MKVNRFKDIPKFTNEGSYAVDMEPSYLLSWIEEEKEDGLELNPDFQRGHVWNEEQQRSYIEYILRGGKTGRDLYFNYPEWNSFRKMKPGEYQDYVCVDGLQRITAWQAFFEEKLFENEGELSFEKVYNVKPTDQDLKDYTVIN